MHIKFLSFNLKIQNKQTDKLKWNSQFCMQVHRGEITDCSSMTKINLFIQVTMCLSNITCCLDALCYYFAAQEARSARQSIKISLTRERKHTFSTSEVWTLHASWWDHLPIVHSLTCVYLWFFMAVSFKNEQAVDEEVLHALTEW